MAFTITDPSMKRYMMSMDDAVNQILRVVGLEPGTYILDMGEEMSVSELLARFRKEHNCADHPVKVTGPKPGEKDRELLCWPSEHLTHFKAGANVIHRVHHSPFFEYSHALRVSGQYDDDKTMNELKRLFRSVGA
jgi:FlaA1/EpsC-like NDP-sugar epimerase